MTNVIKEALDCPYVLQNFDDVDHRMGLYEAIEFRFDCIVPINEVAETVMADVYADDNYADVVLVMRDGSAHCFPVYDKRHRDFVW